MFCVGCLATKNGTFFFLLNLEIPFSFIVYCLLIFKHLRTIVFYKKVLRKENSKHEKSLKLTSNMNAIIVALITMLFIYTLPFWSPEELKFIILYMYIKQNLGMSATRLC